MASSKLKLFWWSEIHLMNKTKENFGDLIGKYLVEKITYKEAIFTHPSKQKWKHKLSSKPIYVTAGSILAHVNEFCIVWGSGIITKNQVVRPAQFLCVRGPQTRKKLLEQGYHVPEYYGDPALLLPHYYQPNIQKKFIYGVVPHYVDFKKVQEQFQNVPNVKVINLMTNSIENVVDEFLECEYVVSSSLHGLIVSHAYGIPALWMEFSDRLFGDGIKFQDYFESVGLSNYKALSPDINFIEIDFNSVDALPKIQYIKKCQNDLLTTCPFR
jgi:hypothetical protein